MFGKSKVAMMVAELVGTAILTLVVLSVRSSGIGYSFFVALGAGLAVAALTLAVGATSGAQLNPALTVGLALTRKVKVAPAVIYVAMQLLGGGLANVVYFWLLKTHLQNTAGHFEWRVLAAEAIGTFIFVWGWTAASARRFTGLQFGAAAGGAFALGIMVASLASAGVVNPAIALGTHAWNIWGWSNAGWGTYLAGPLIGGTVAAFTQKYLFTGTEVAEAAVVATPAARATGASTATVASNRSTSTRKKTTSRKKK